MACTAQLPFLSVLCIVLSTDVTAIPLEEFYQYGSEAGDETVGRIDDGYGSTADDIIRVNNNGLVVFEPEVDEQNATYVPVVVPFCSDVDTRPEDGGFVWYRNSTTPTLLQRALSDIRRAYPFVSHIDFLFIATWDQVGYYDRNTKKKNTFQCVFARSGNQTYVIYLYADGLMQRNSDAYCSGPVGYRTNDGVTFLLPGSRPCDNLDITSVSNANVSGMLVFRHDIHDPVFDPGCDEGHIRLVDGIINKTGQAEVCMDNVWKSVADDHDWGVEEATLICRELGLPTDEVFIGQGLQNAADVGVSCVGNETRLTNCSHHTMFSCGFRAARMSCLTTAEAKECGNVMNDSWTNEQKLLCDNRYGFCVPYIKSSAIHKNGGPCDNVYKEGSDYVYIKKNLTVDYDHVLAAIDEAEDTVEQAFDDDCTVAIRKLICQHYLPPCGSSTHYETPVPVCSAVCYYLSERCQRQWNVYQNQLELAPLTCTSTEEYLTPLQYSDCNDVGIVLSNGKAGSAKTEVIASTTSIAVLLLLLLMIFLFYVLRRRSIMRKRIEEPMRYRSETNVERYQGVDYRGRSSLKVNISAEMAISCLVKEMEQKQQLISSSHIDLRESIGQGEFGIVYKAILNGWRGEDKQHVAVKTMKGLFSAVDLKSLIEESMIMSNFNHPNVMKLIGVCIDSKDTPYVVMPYMTHGSLLTYLRKKREEMHVTEDKTNSEFFDDTKRKLLSMCLQIAKGMAYLAGENFVHRDLATRNCMIDKNFVIKVADFGLSEDIYSKNYFRQGKSNEDGEVPVKLPARWMALESLNDGIFNEKTDVWSFGVTCWEVFTLGKNPYPGIDPLSLSRYLERGERLDKPLNEACSQQIYDLMMSCWGKVPKMRPTFSELVENISTSLEGMTGYLELTP